ncbi:putative mitochondrial carnitine O-acetyltransferase [Ceratocystis fimbriata CBS 114723]|uniref:Putative mitochondrial carnitine O-acetyltransferase n=1 Tax=Ceratocystis fimbriata CBS 114723 TaxID=1035309 RepID=A0A2C5WXY9_9PEZI|nr:putative mitochondrial carnitine O-acetyltransferase [Ceratocystis fimbriata CBS 114723]
MSSQATNKPAHAKVRFTEPRPLGETLSKAPTSGYIPRSVPDSSDLIKTLDPKKSATVPLPRPPMATHNLPRRGQPGLTFAAQDKLPKLPIPSLEETVKRYLGVVKPLQEPSEHEETKLAAERFLAQDGPELQKQLIEYADGQSSYIEQFWYDSYLNFESSVVFNLNPFFLLEDDPTPARNNQVTRAASLVYSSLEFVRAIRLEELPPDSVKGKPLCMHQYSRLFGTARVPTENGCKIEAYPESQHIVVMCHGQFYWFDVLDDNNDLIMTEKDLSVNLQTIIDDATQLPILETAKGALGLLTAQDRKQWARCRQVLSQEQGRNNADCLSMVDSALFILCLDYNEPSGVAGLCQNMLCGSSQLEKGVQIGTCINRWYDKLQIIVCKNGSAGINFEHTGVDGHTVLRFASDIYTDTILRFARSINGQAPSLWATTSPDPAKRDPESFGDVTTTPHKLEWDIPDSLSLAVRFSEAHLTDLVMQHEFECLDFGAYGKNFITSMGFSPDAFVQMAFQSAYYSLYGHIDCTYEPAMTKTYLHGRTEAIRTVSQESVDFVQAFWGTATSAEEKVDTLRKACQRHTATTRECAMGKGCDRHLFALLSIWRKTVDDELNSSRADYSEPSGYSSPLSYSGESMDNSALDDSILVQRFEEHAISDDVEIGATDLSRGDIAPNARHSDSNASSLDTTEYLISAEGTDNTTVSPPSMVTRSRENSTSSRASRSRDTQPLPSLFADSGWDRLNTCILSTSNCGNPSLRQFGFGPTSGSGFGIGYIIKDESISICVSSKHRQTSRFLGNLESYLLEIRRMLRITTQQSNLKASRAREIDTRTRKNAPRPQTHAHANAHKMPPAKARLIHGRQLDVLRLRGQSPSGTRSPTEYSIATSEDCQGGYGFFDAGNFLHPLRPLMEGRDSSRDTRPSERAQEQARRRRDVGKVLPLAEY